MFESIADFLKDNMQTVGGLALMPLLAKIMQSISGKMKGSQTIEKMLDKWSKALDKMYSPIKASIGVFGYNIGVFVSSYLQKNAIIKLVYKYFVQPILLVSIGGVTRLGGKVLLLLADAVREFGTKVEKGLRIESTSIKEVKPSK